MVELQMSFMNSGPRRFFSIAQLLISVRYKGAVKFTSNAPHWQREVLLCLSIGIFLLSAGCSSSNNVAGVVAKMNDSSIKRAANLFGAAIERSGWRSPKDEAAFREFIQNKMVPQKLKLMGVDPQNIDAVFVSDRDGKPFKFRYGLELWPFAIVPVVFEQQGINGLRQVAYSDGRMVEAGDAEYQKLWGEKGSAPASAPPPSAENAGSGTSKQSAAK